MRASGAQAHINARLDIAKIFARARAVAQADARARARAHAHAVTQTSETITQMRAQTWTDTRWPTENSRLWSQQEQDVLGARA